MFTNTHTLRTLTVGMIGAGAVAVGALTLSAPALAAPNHAVTSIQPTCEQHPELYASGAVLGVYSTQRRGIDRDQICKAYDAGHKLLGVYTVTDYGYYQLRVAPLPTQVLEQR
jgi:hypothetical protein